MDDIEYLMIANDIAKKQPDDTLNKEFLKCYNSTKEVEYIKALKYAKQIIVRLTQ